MHLPKEQQRHWSCLVPALCCSNVCVGIHLLESRTIQTHWLSPRLATNSCDVVISILLGNNFIDNLRRNFINIEVFVLLDDADDVREKRLGPGDTCSVWRLFVIQTECPTQCSSLSRHTNWKSNREHLWHCVIMKFISRFFLLVLLCQSARLSKGFCDDQSVS